VEEARMKGQKETKQKEAAQQHQNCPWLPATVHGKYISYLFIAQEQKGEQRHALPAAN